MKLVMPDQKSVENLMELKDYGSSIIPFIGAGMSVSSGYPTWFDFLKDQFARLTISTVVENDLAEGEALLYKYDYLAAASKLNNLLNLNLAAAVKESFSSRDKSQQPEYLSFLEKLNISTYLTTNYDALIEMHARLNDRNLVVKLPFSSANIIDLDKKRSPMVIKLHGSFDDSQSIIITKEQYEDKYEKNPYITDIMDYFWTSKILLFMGCSLEKDYLVQYMEKLSQEKQWYCHFAFLPMPSDKQALNKMKTEMIKLRIKPIWFNQGDYSKIPEYLNYLSSDGVELCTNDVLDSSNFEVNKMELKSESTVHELCECFIDTVASTCEVQQREKLFKVLLENSGTKESIATSSLDVLIDNLLNTSEYYALDIFGDPGTGKSTIASFIYLELHEKFDKKKIRPILIDLHLYEETPIKDAVKSLEELLNKTSGYIEQGDVDYFVIIDGLNKYERINSDLNDCMKKYVSKLSRFKNVKIIRSIGTIPKKIFPAYIEKDWDGRASMQIELRQFNSKNIKEIILALINVHKCDIHHILHISKNRAKDKAARKSKSQVEDIVITSVKNLVKIISGDETDYRTINFIIKNVMGKINIFSEIGKVYISHFGIRDGKSRQLFFEKAERISRYMLNQSEGDRPGDERVWVYKSISLRNYILAYCFVYTVLGEKHDNLDMYNFVFSPTLNYMIKIIINEKSEEEERFIEKTITKYDDYPIALKIQALYFLGRTLHNKEKAKNFLIEQFKNSEKELSEMYNGNTKVDVIMKYRTAGISLIYLGCGEIEKEFYQMLIYHPEVHRIHRLFHMKYYICESENFGETLDISNVSCTKDGVIRIYDAAYHTLRNKSPDTIPSYYLNIITLFNVVNYDHYHLKGSESPLYLKDSFKDIVIQLLNNNRLTNETVCHYIRYSASKWKIQFSKCNIEPIYDENVYQTVTTLLYRLKSIMRTGWLKKGRNIDSLERPESVADHIWGCLTIAMLYLSEDIKLCSFMQGEDLSDYNEYNKSKIISLLMFHDFSESYIGDINVEEYYKEGFNKKELEREFSKKIRIYDSFSYYKSFHTLSDLIKEYKELETINSKIAFDIDKIEPLFQLYVHQDMLIKINGKERVLAEISNWKISVFERLKTIFGEKFYTFVEKFILSSKLET